MRKKLALFFVLTVLFLLLSGMSFSAYAAESEEAALSEPVESSYEGNSELKLAFGSCGYNLNWTLENGVLTISGSGSMYVFESASDAPWYYYRSKINSVVISEGVTSIGYRAFSGYSSLTSVIIPSSVTSIGEGAFEYCSSLTSINADSSNNYYKSVDGVLFSKGGKTLIAYPTGRSGIYSIPKGVTSIGYRAFYGCSSLTSITIPSSVTSIGYRAFSDCSSLTSVTIPSSVTSIGDSAFSSCSSLTSITIPSSVTSIGEWAFYGCSRLTSVVISSRVTSIGSHAFFECSRLTSISIPEGVTSIGSDAFENCSSLTSISIPSSVKSIGAWAFYNCSSLTSVTLSEGVMRIGEDAFRGCSSLTSVTIPSSITSIGSSAFYGCSRLTSITIPSSVTNIGDYAFYYCSSLTSVIIHEGVTSIGEDAFRGCSRLTSITIPSSVTSISNYAFEGCSSMTSVTLSEGVMRIGEDAFRGCSSLTSITIPSSVTSIGSSAFYDCNSLRKVDYLGSKTMWNTISIGSNNNSLSNAAAEQPSGISISAQPQNVTCSAGETAAFTVTAAGEGLTYQWYFKSAAASAFKAITTGTSARYACKTTDAMNGRMFYCVITDKNGNTVQTNTVNITIAAAEQPSGISISAQPKDITCTAGETAVFTVTATGEGLTYQWYFKSASASAFKATTTGTKAAYSFKTTDAMNGRMFYCVITDKNGKTVKTDTVSITIAAAEQPSGISISAQPQNVTCSAGQTAAFTVTAAGEGLTYQWYFKSAAASAFKAITTGTSARYACKTTDAMNGRMFYCVITDKNGKTVKTDTVTLNIPQQLAITAQSEDVTCAAGETAVFSVTATGDDLTYQWYYKSASATEFKAVRVGTSARYPFKTTDAMNGRQFYCVITDKNGNTVKTDTVTITIAADQPAVLSITSQPQSVACALGETATFTVEAAGEGLTYKWYYKNPGTSSFKVHSGQTANTYSLELTEGRNGRQMYCIITDANGKTLKTNTVTMTIG